MCPCRLPAVLLLYAFYKVHIPLIPIFDANGLPYIIGMTDCAASHAAVNGGEASASWANVNTPSQSAYKSADSERASSFFVCPAIRLCLLASLSCYIPFLWPCRTFFNAHYPVMTGQNPKINLLVHL